MNYLIIILLFILGSILGSFYGCMGYRIPNKISTIKPSSYCPNCKKPLKWYMNIPLFSYIFLKGKCYYCKEKIGISYFLIELFTGISFSLSYLVFGFQKEFFILIILISVLSVTLISDIKYYYISDRVIIISVISIILVNFIFLKDNYNFINSLINASIIFIVMLLIKICGDKIFKKESLGGGDIKLMLITGFSLSNLINILLSLFIASVIGLIFSLICNKKTKGIIPFGPFLIIGNIIIYIISYYYQIELLII